MDGRDVQVDPARAAYDAAYAAYTNHIMACRQCHAPVARYCTAGAPLMLEADARYLAAINDLSERKRRLRIEYTKNPEYGLKLKARVIELFNLSMEE